MNDDESKPREWFFLVNQHGQPLPATMWSESHNNSTEIHVREVIRGKAYSPKYLCCPNPECESMFEIPGSVTISREQFRALKKDLYDTSFEEVEETLFGKED